MGKTKYLIKEILKLFNNTHVLKSEYFRETLLRPQRMVAECWLTDSLLELAVDGVLDLGVSSKES